MIYILKDWVIPPKIYSILRSIYGQARAVFLYSYILERNKDLKNIHQEKRCFILGNGPSIKNQDMKLLANEIVFSLSNGYYHPEYDIYRPRYHVVPYLTFSNLEGGMNHEKAIEWFKQMDERILDSEIFLGINQLSLVKKNQIFNKRKVYWLHYGFSNYKNNIPDLTGNIPEAQSGPQLAISIAAYMGFTQIYLLGVEHDDICNEKYEYFYERSVMIFKDPLVDEKNYFKEDIVQRIKTANRLFQIYGDIKDMAEKNKIEIKNCTLGGLLNIFPRVKFEDLFNK